MYTAEEVHEGNAMHDTDDTWNATSVPVVNSIN